MPGLQLAHHLALFAVVNGLRRGGEIGEPTITAIVEELNAVTKISDDWGHRDTTEDLRKLADAIERGKPSY